MTLYVLILSNPDAAMIVGHCAEPLADIVEVFDPVQAIVMPAANGLGLGFRVMSPLDWTPRMFVRPIAWYAAGKRFTEEYETFVQKAKAQMAGIQLAPRLVL